MPDFTKEQHDFFTACEFKVINSYYPQFVNDNNFDYIDELLSKRIYNKNWVNLITTKTYVNWDNQFIPADKIDLYYEWVTKGYGNETFFKFFNEKEIEYCYHNQYDDDKTWLPPIDRMEELWSGDVVYQVYCFKNYEKIDENVSSYLCRRFECEDEEDQVDLQAELEIERLHAQMLREGENLY